MTNDTLQRLLAELHERLGGSPALDDETRRLLGLVSADIHRLGVAGEASPNGIEALAVRFEADHPAISASLRQAVDILSKAGI
jgi:hypothetical protein